MKKKNKILMIITILILIIVIVTTIIIINYRKSKYGNEYEKNEDESDIKINYEYEKIDNYTLFFTVSNCVQKYFDYISLSLDSNENVSDYKTKQEELGIYTEEEKKQAIYNILDDEYIKNNNINLNDIYNYVDTLNTEAEFIPIEMGMLDGERIQRFCVNGTINDKNIYIIVNLDYYNMTYSIEPMLESKYNSINEVKLESKNYEIAEKDNNNLDYIRMSEEDIAREYMINYKTNAINNPEKAYELLDKEYREKRFGNIDNYKKYISENEDQLLNVVAKEYNISEKEGYTQYVIVDTNGNYYIFKVTDIMEYTLLTDFYTIDVEEIANNYDNSNVQEKVAINIQKVIAALNAKDYGYVYGKLAEEFKTNKYPTLESFKTYISGVVTGNRKITFNDFYNEGETYIYNISLVGTTVSTGDPVNMQIIMRLNENRDFVMSFNTGE